MMTTTTQTITDFLLARIGEDEAVAQAAIDKGRPGTHWQWVRAYDDVVVEDPALDDTDEYQYSLRTVEHFPTASGVGDLPAFVIGAVFPSESLGHVHIARHDPARVLAECKAKRQVIDAAWISDMNHEAERDDRTRAQVEADGDEPFIVFALAAVYASHPDFRAEWADWLAERV
jgi:hypothetical protein